MNTAGLREALRAAPLFAAFTDDELDAVEARFIRRTHARGEYLWRAGDDADEFILVVSGELEVWGTAAGGGEELVGRLGPSDCAGEVALLLDERRSAAVRCARGAEIAALSRPDFHALVRDDPRILAHLTELLSQRALSLARRGPTDRGSIVTGLVSDRDSRWGPVVAPAIAAIAGDVVGVSVLLVEAADESSPDPVALGSIAGGDRPYIERGWRPGVDRLRVTYDDAIATDDLVAAANAMAAWRDHRLVLLDLTDVGLDPSSVAQAVDVLVEVTTRAGSAAPTLPSNTRAYRLMELTGGRPPLNHCDIFAVDSPPPPGGVDALLADAATPASRTLARLTRRVLGSTVGVALGGGAAFGIAHVGVIMALEEAGIPIDVVAGASMGSIVGIGYAAGLSGLEMQAIAHRIGNVRTILSALDPALTLTGLLNGRRLVAIFSPLIDQTTFEELVVPCRIVAMDIETGERVDIGTGRLDDAFRASCAIPLVFTPVHLEGRTLVDGGVVDPLPVDVAREMGADVVVAVNVAQLPTQGVATPVSRAFRFANRFNPVARLRGGGEAPAFLDVLMNSLQVVQHELGMFTSLASDVHVHVPIAGFTWIDFHRAPEIIERGYEAGKQVVPEIQEAVARRLEPDR